MLHIFTIRPCVNQNGCFRWPTPGGFKCPIQVYMWFHWTPPANKLTTPPKHLWNSIIPPKITRIFFAPRNVSLRFATESEWWDVMWVGEPRHLFSRRNLYVNWTVTFRWWPKTATNRRRNREDETWICARGIGIAISVSLAKPQPNGLSSPFEHAFLGWIVARE